jgi:hypothetical protein
MYNIMLKQNNIDRSALKGWGIVIITMHEFQKHIFLFYLFASTIK